MVKLFYLPASCYYPVVMMTATKRCSQSYSKQDMDTDNHEPNWIHSTTNVSTPPFTFQTKESINGSDFWSKFYFYDGGGYIANLGVSENEAKTMSEYLQQNHWIDEFTRAVFVEFSILNGNSNLFNLVQAVFEILPTGLILPSIRVEAVQLYRYVGSVGLLSLIVEILLSLFVIGLLVIEIIHMVKKKREYFREFWNIVQLVLIALYFVGLVFYVLRSLSTVETVENMMNNKGEFNALFLCRIMLILSISLLYT